MSDAADDFYTALGLRVRRIREQQGLTQQDLADHLGLSRASVANLEAGRQRISAYRLTLIASALEISVQDLLPPVATPETAHISRADPDHLALLRQLLVTSTEPTRQETHASP